LTVNTPANITTAPVGGIVNGLSNVVLSVVAGGTAPFTYQWYFNKAPIVGQQGSTLTLLSVTAANSGDYSVTVTNAGGNVTSGNVALTVEMTPYVTTPYMTPQKVAKGGAVTFTVAASGVQPLKYQWLRDGRRMVNNGRISGATSPTLTIARLTTADVAEYSVTVTNALGTTTSMAVMLTLSSSSAEKK
jgi:hypothetical protein